MGRKSDFERDNDKAVNSHDCNTERGEGKWSSSGDGRTTKEDNPYFSDD